MRLKPFIVVVVLLLALILSAGAFSAGYLVGRGTDALANSPLSITSQFQQQLMGDRPTVEAGQGGTPVDLQELFVPFWQTWQIVQEEFVDQPVDQELMMRGAIRGMLESLGDEHTSYLDPVMFERANAQLQGEEYEGIGAWVDTTQDYLTIISPMPGSPAEKAGLRPNDKIIAIDGDDMTGIDGELVRQRVLGPKGSRVILTILREGQEPFDVEITRASIVVPSVASTMLESKVAHIQLFTFGDDTAKDLREALKEALDQKPVGIVLDLRNNGGGYLQTAIDVTSEFIGDGVIMYEIYGDGTKSVYDAKEGGLATNIPVVVLINEGSASASEIVAGAIQDRGRGKLVGVTSFGKGSVQTYVALKNNEGAVRVTVARWLTPQERQINKLGLQPDVPVSFTEEDAAAGRDPQLDKAVEMLVQGLVPVQFTPPTPIPTPTLTPTPAP